MGDLLADGEVWLNSQLQAHAARLVTYRRGAASVTLLASVGQSTHEATDFEGVTIEERTRDYLVAAADLTFGSGSIEPQRGDVIEETIGGVVTIHHVLPPGGNTPAWEWSGDTGGVRRIHTKER